LGRPGQLLRLDAERARFVAIELGVTHTYVAALPVGVALEDEWTHSFATPKSVEGWVRELKKLAPKLPDAELWGVLISVPGIVDENADQVLFSPNLHWLEKTNLAQLVRTVWDLPVVLVQEIRALALGHLTAEPVGEDFFLVDFGSGVGGAIVVEGQLYAQPIPLSGEIGHTPVPGNQRSCGCGAVGCLETLVSQGGLLQSFAAAGGGAAPTWKSLASRITRAGLEPWLIETLNSTAQVISGALNVLGVHRVVLTGNLTELPASVLKHLESEIQKGAMWARFGEVVCQSAPHRRAAGLVAAGIDRLVLPDEEERSPRRPELTGAPAGK
jgi:predicted NBD/HSP70 family sugar kinase